ncbi:type II secretion system protein [Chloroflexota bacterium]
MTVDQPLFKPDRNKKESSIPARHHLGAPGFTLVELLIVLTLLGVLAAVVILNIGGIMARGGEQGYGTDRKAIQSAMVLFFFDGHACDTEPPGDAWDSSKTPLDGHHYPTSTGFPSNQNLEDILATANAAGNTYTFPTQAIWMGLLGNSPSATSTHDKDGARPLTGEMGPYLNNVPESASKHNFSTNTGTYTWIIARDGVTYGLYWDGSTWHEGFSGSYP